MTRKTTGILLIAGAALWYGVLRGVNAIKIQVEKLGLVRVSTNTIDFNLSILIKNPLWIGVAIDEIMGDVYVMSEHVATINQPVRQIIGARRLNRIYITFSAYIEQLGSALLQNIQTGDIRTLTARFDGYIVVKGIKIPIDKQFDLNDMR